MGKDLNYSRLTLLRVIAKYHRIARNVVEALLTIDVSIGRISGKSISSLSIYSLQITIIDKKIINDSKSFKSKQTKMLKQDGL